MEVEKGHRENGGEVDAGEEDGTEEGYRFHGARVAFCGVGQLSLFLGHLKVEFGFFLRDDVVELGSGLVLLVAQERVIRTALLWISNRCNVVYA